MEERIRAAWQGRIAQTNQNMQPLIHLWWMKQRSLGLASSDEASERARSTDRWHASEPYARSQRDRSLCIHCWTQKTNNFLDGRQVHSGLHGVKKLRLSINLSRPWPLKLNSVERVNHEKSLTSDHQQQGEQRIREWDWEKRMREPVKSLPDVSKPGQDALRTRKTRPKLNHFIMKRLRQARVEQSWDKSSSPKTR